MPPHILTFPRLSVNPRSSKVVKEKSCTCQMFARKALCPTLTLTPKPSRHYIRLIRRLALLVINFLPFAICVDGPQIESILKLYIRTLTAYLYPHIFLSSLHHLTSIVSILVRPSFHLESPLPYYYCK